MVWATMDPQLSLAILSTGIRLESGGQLSQHQTRGYYRGYSIEAATIGATSLGGLGSRCSCWGEWERWGLWHGCRGSG